LRAGSALEALSSSLAAAGSVGSHVRRRHVRRRGRPGCCRGPSRSRTAARSAYVTSVPFPYPSSRISTVRDEAFPQGRALFISSSHDDIERLWIRVFDGDADSGECCVDLSRRIHVGFSSSCRRAFATSFALKCMRRDSGAGHGRPRASYGWDELRRQRRNDRGGPNRRRKRLQAPTVLHSQPLCTSFA